MAVLSRPRALLTVAVLALLGGRCFTPSMAPGRRGSVAMRAASDDAIGKAAAKLSKAAYPFMTQVNWNDPTWWTVPGSDAITWTKAIGKIIDHGASMDMELIKAGCKAHSKAIKGLPSSGICTEAELTEINAAIGRMIASAPEAKTMAVHDAVKPLIPDAVPKYLMSKVDETSAKNAYAALLEFTETVKANPITPSAPVSSTVSSESASAISAASTKLGQAAYPFMKSVDWTSDLYGKTVPGNPQKTMKSIDKMIEMGIEMDGAALQEAALAHVKAIEGMDAKGVMTPEDFDAINTGIGKTIASVPVSSVMDVFQSVGGLVSGPGIPQYVLSQQNGGEALKAYQGLMEFKDTVREAQIRDQKMEEDTISANQNALLITAIILVNVLGAAFVHN